MMTIDTRALLSALLIFCCTQQAFSQSGASKRNQPKLATELAAVDHTLFRINTGDGHGSGFQYRVPGYVLTNRHVLESVRVGDSVDVHPVRVARDGMVGEGPAVKGTVRYKHPDLDVAVIEVPTVTTQTCLTARTVDGDKHVPRGIELFAHGFPGIGDRAAPTLSRGLLSAHYEDPLTEHTFYLTDTALSPGSSGGPVTDATGAVIGIATAVSLVREGAGTSWGYILPIRAVDQALSCTGGFAALPKPFDPARHLAAIRAKSHPHQAAAAFHAGVMAAVTRCATADELKRNVDLLSEAVMESKGSLDLPQWFAMAKSSDAALKLVVARLFELRFLGDESAPDALGWAIEPSTLVAWQSSLVAGIMKGLPEEARVGVYSEMLSGVSEIAQASLASAANECDIFLKAAAALESPEGPDRRRIKDFSNALTRLLWCRVELEMLSEDSLTPDRESLPPALRSKVDAFKAQIQRDIARWNALPEECRDVADQTLGALVKGAEGKSGNDLDAVVAGLLDSGWTQWGETKRGKTKGSGHGFTIDFDEGHVIAYALLLSPAGDNCTLTVSGSDEVMTSDCDSGAIGDVRTAAADLFAHGKIAFEFESTRARDYEYEFAIVYRRSMIPTLTAGLRAISPKGRVIGVKTCFIPAGKVHEYSVETNQFRSFWIGAQEARGSDVDVEILDAHGRVVAQDTEPDSNPVVGVPKPTSETYTIRISNPSKRAASVDSVCFALEK